MENSTIGNLVPRVFPLIIPHLHLAVLEHLEHHTLVIRIINYKAYNDLLLFVYLSMLLQRFYSLILPNPGVQIAYNKYMSIYSG